MTATHSGREHHITIPRHTHLAIGLLNHLLADIASARGTSKQELMRELFG